MVFFDKFDDTSLSSKTFFLNTNFHENKVSSLGGDFGEEEI